MNFTLFHRFCFAFFTLACGFQVQAEEVAKTPLQTLQAIQEMQKTLLQNHEESQIRKLITEYVDAYNRREAKTVASFWAEDAIYVRPTTGEEIEGRAAIEKALESTFKTIGDKKLAVKVTKITFPSENEAVESGSFHMEYSEGNTAETAFKAFFEKNNGKWELAEVRDVDIAPLPNQYQHLKDLEWLIGHWIDEDDDVEIDSTYEWINSKNFISGKFSVTTEGKLELEGAEIIGWDPVKEKIRSWVFDSDGGFAESTWTKSGNQWVVETAQTLPNGTRGSAINTFTPNGNDQYTWESEGREVGGKLLPDIEPIIVKKKKEG